MRFACFFSLAALALLILLHSSGAWAAETAKGEAASNSSCGASTKDAIASAEKALSTNSATSENRALACLIVAVKALEAERLDTVRGTEKAHMLRVSSNR